MSGFNPEIFKWARESAGMDIPGAADALKIKAATLEAIEGGDADPSRPMLLRMTKVYRRSLLTFYLPAPPRKGDRGHDYRTVAVDRNTDAEANLDALVRDVRARQALVRSVLEDDEDVRVVDFVGSAIPEWGVERLAAAIQQRLRFSRDEFRAQRTAEDAFAFLRSLAEDAGVFVLLIGNLGSHHSAIPVEAFRGVAVADPIAPFVVINDQDARTAWSFTLLHELAHLWLGATGVSGGRPEHQIEQFCNAVAAEVLVASTEIGRFDVHGLSFDQQLEAIAHQAQAWKVSRQMLAYNLLLAGRIKHANWQALDGRFREMWLAEKARERELNKAAAKTGGPTYYITRRHRLGRAMLTFARQSIDSGSLTPAKAAQVLGVAPRSVYPLLQGG